MDLDRSLDLAAAGDVDFRARRSEPSSVGVPSLPSMGREGSVPQVQQLAHNRQTSGDRAERSGAGDWSPPSIPYGPGDSSGWVHLPVALKFFGVLAVALAARADEAEIRMGVDGRLTSRGASGETDVLEIRLIGGDPSIVVQGDWDATFVHTPIER